MFFLVAKKVGKTWATQLDEPHEGTKNEGPNLRKSDSSSWKLAVVGWSFLVSNWGNSQMLQTVLEGSQVLLSCDQTWWLCHILFRDVKGHCSNASSMLAHEIYNSCILQKGFFYTLICTHSSTGTKKWELKSLETPKKIGREKTRSFFFFKTATILEDFFFTTWAFPAGNKWAFRRSAWEPFLGSIHTWVPRKIHSDVRWWGPPHRIHGTILVYLPTWMVDFYGKCR